jgi:HSP20 family molecular chaperone IbpA/DNA-binding CsgD family transcriptional regulator
LDCGRRLCDAAIVGAHRWTEAPYVKARMDNLSGRLRQIVHRPQKSNPKLLILLAPTGGTAVAGYPLAGDVSVLWMDPVADRRKIMARSSLTPVHSNGLLERYFGIERDFGNPFLWLHRDLLPYALHGSAEAAVDKESRPDPGYEIADALRRVAALSSREHDVLKGLLAGQRNKLIASDLGISVRTVEVHRTRMMKRLGVHQLAEAVRLALLAMGNSAATHPLLQEAPMTFNIDLTETDREVRIFVDLPGLNENDIHVSVDDNVLTIRAETKRVMDKPQFAERSYRFLGSLRLPYSVDYNKIRTNFGGGVLTVILPKCEGRAKRRTIPVHRVSDRGTVSSSEQARRREQQFQIKSGNPKMT